MGAERASVLLVDPVAGDNANGARSGSSNDFFLCLME